MPRARVAGRRPAAVERLPVRVVFFGTPSFAVPTLDRLVHDERFDIALVVTQPDRPAGRGRRQVATAVAERARSLGLPLYQPTTLRDAAARQPLAEQEADLFVVAAFGLIFGPKTLALPRRGSVNLHASLLPRFRGASPVAAAIAAGDRTTGVTLMLMETGLDTGPMLASVETPVAPDDTTGSLTDRLARLGAELAPNRLVEFVAGKLEAIPQPSLGGSLTRPLTKADGWLDWHRPATELERHIRAMSPWPRGWTSSDEATTLQIHRASIVANPSGAKPGESVVSAGRALVIACGVDALRLETVQPAGGRPMDGEAFLAGRPSLPSSWGQHRPPLTSPLVVPA